LRQFAKIIEDRQQVDVGEGEVLAGKVAGRCDGAIEHGELRLHLGQRRFDPRLVGAAIRRAGEEMRAEILAHQHRVHRRVDDREPLLDPRRRQGLARHQIRSREGAIDVAADRPRLAQREGAVAQRRDLAERMDRVDLLRVRKDRHQRVGHAFLGAGDAADPDVIALRRTDELKVRHALLPP